jgi:hypothetical protein
MRCVVCNKNLSDWESTARHAITGEFLDTCRKCLKDIPIPVRGREDLNPFETMEEDVVLVLEEDNDN